MKKEKGLSLESAFVAVVRKQGDLRDLEKGEEWRKIREE